MSRPNKKITEKIIAFNFIQILLTTLQKHCVTNGKKNYSIYINNYFLENCTYLLQSH